ncbi:hypothetical protein AYO45_04035 [Gammaproteobacteria bacterium SCGC AG-212-F23]|nr:hypothetical protein AYO45_04035 [Gammaproteobacteria bacterium SCGC AG-212-F23]
MLHNPWQPFAAVSTMVPEKLQTWLTYTGSFMERLKAHAIVDTKISVLNQGWEKANSDEINFLQTDEKTLIREVLIGNQTNLWMYARSVFPESTLTEQEQSLAHLGVKPLGEFLFNHPEMQRSDFKMKKLLPSKLWARCSLFYLRGKKLLLTEIFSPALMELGA